MLRGRSSPYLCARCAVYGESTEGTDSLYFSTRYWLSTFQDIFATYINHILPALADPSNAYNGEHAYVLADLAEMKSIILLTDLDNSEGLILQLFTTCFDVVSGSSRASAVEVGKVTEQNLAGLLAVIVDETQALPMDVVDIIISQFLRVDPKSTGAAAIKSKKGTKATVDGKQSTLLLKDYPPAYNMAKAICTGCSDKMTTHIGQYFSNIIVDASRSKTTNGLNKASAKRISDIDMSDDEFEDATELEKAHRLIRELWRACPDVLQAVVGQLEQELHADSQTLRLMAVQTIGDLAAGVGINGPPQQPVLDPAAYPSGLSASKAQPTPNRLLMAVSPKPFTKSHPATWASFLGRGKDKSVEIRGAWACALGRILMTSFGGIGFEERELGDVLAGMTACLNDPDEKVRLSAIGACGSLSYKDVLEKFYENHKTMGEESVISTLFLRFKDIKPPVREASMKTLSILWGIASGDIQDGNDRATTLLEAVPDRVLQAVFTGDKDIQSLVESIMYDSFIPLSFPPIKVRMNRSESQKQRARDREDDSQEQKPEPMDPDLIRVQRILTFAKGLQDKSLMFFRSMMKSQVQHSNAMTVFLKACEDNNGGVTEQNGDVTKTQLKKCIDLFAARTPHPHQVTDHLNKFAKLHDRRNYQLIRFAIDVSSDYKTVTKAIKELSKRISDGTGTTAEILESLRPLIHKCALLVCNRSHIPHLMAASRSEDQVDANVASLILGDISSNNPAILKAQIIKMCEDVEMHAPNMDVAEDESMADTLKACSAFAKKYPKDMPKERKFISALSEYAINARSARAAKHAVAIMMAVTERKEMWAKGLLEKALATSDYTHPSFLAKLATLAQLNLLTPEIADSASSKITTLVTKELLGINRHTTANPDEYLWSETVESDDLYQETQSKIWALKILVNRSLANDAASAAVAQPVLEILSTLITNEGEFTSGRNTVGSQKSQLRLEASRLLLKLCAKNPRKFEPLITPQLFNQIATVTQDRLLDVRKKFVATLTKYLAAPRIHPRWLSSLFLLAFEPDAQLRQTTVTWLKHQARRYSTSPANLKDSKKRTDNVIETLFSNLLSLLAHHPDYPDSSSEDYHSELLDFSRYILFYLTTVSNDQNLSLIFHIAQRLKAAQDAVTPITDDALRQTISERLYTLSDLAQTTIRNYADLLSHSKGHASNVNILQTYPGRAPLPSALFAPIQGHERAQEIADKNYLPEEVAVELERVVHQYVKPGRKMASNSKKRKSDAGGREDSLETSDDEQPTKKPKRKTTTLPVRRATNVKTPRPARKSGSAAPSSEARPTAEPSRKSARVSNVKAPTNYAEGDSSEDDKEMEEIDAMASSRGGSRQAKTASPLASKSRKSDRKPVEVVEEEKGDESQEGEGAETAPDPEADKENEPDPIADTEMSDVPVDNGDDDDDATAESREPSPSPLRAKTNGVHQAASQAVPKSNTGLRAARGKIVVSEEGKEEGEQTSSPAAAKGKAVSKRGKAPADKKAPTVTTATRETRSRTAK